MITLANIIAMKQTVVAVVTQIAQMVALVKMKLVQTKAVMYPNILDKLCYTSFLFSYCMHWTNMDMHTSMPVVHASTTNMHWTNILYALDGQNWYV